MRFTPALGETVHVSVPPVHTTSLQLQFTANLTSQEYQENLQAGARLQLWSDIPTGGRGPGEWGETDFEVVPGNTLSGLSLLPWDYKAETPTCSLIVSIPFPKESHRFSFTYRILYPSGEARWLGTFGHNGSLSIDRQTSHLLPGEGWHMHDGSFTWSTRGKLVEDLEVAKIANPAQWAVWGFGGDRSVLTRRVSD